MSRRYRYTPNRRFPGRMSLLCRAADFFNVLIISSEIFVGDFGAHFRDFEFD